MAAGPGEAGVSEGTAQRRTGLAQGRGVQRARPLAVTLRPALRIAPLLPACKFFVSFFKFGLVCAEVSSQNLQP
ncbi:hypothetical protein CRX72_10370 [Pantoea sp. BRM17]|nr:hypothetical protein CRX72_10370 [Pantoea sp. BRM17]